MMRTGAAFLTLFAAFAGASTAEAQVAEPQDFAAERFHLSIGKEGILNIESAEMPQHMGWDVSLWAAYLDDVLVATRPNAAGESERVGSIIKSRVDGAFSLSFGLWDFLQLGVSIPVTLTQSRDEIVPGFTPSLATLTKSGTGDVRVLPKLRVLNRKKHGIGLGVILPFTLPSGQSENYFGENEATFTPQLALSTSASILHFALNVGYRFRPETKFADLETTDELVLGFGTALRFADAGGPPVGIDLSLSAAASADDAFTNANQNYLELLGALNYDADWIIPFVGGGIGLNRGYGAPDFRIVGGLRFAGGRFADADDDGVDDRDDQCPDAREDRDAFQDADGCPDPDNDQDSVLDVRDGAPNDPEDLDGFEDEDGVPDPDNDGDGILDGVDRCPDEAGRTDQGGCPDGDKDSDGVADSNDRCPTKPEDKDGFKDADGCPDDDNDEDGVVDSTDACRDIAGPVENLGCPDTDRDGDGVVDRLDNCPKIAGTPKNQGCLQRQLVVIRSEKLEILDRVYFGTGSAKIRRRSFTLLMNVALVLKSHPEIKTVEVQGHTDNRGKPEVNERLSQRRAESVRKFLIKQGVPEDRLTATGYGESLPIETNNTQRGRGQNRRVEFKIIGNRVIRQSVPNEK